MDKTLRNLGTVDKSLHFKKDLNLDIDPYLILKRYASVERDTVRPRLSHALPVPVLGYSTKLLNRRAIPAAPSRACSSNRGSLQRITLERTTEPGTNLLLLVVRN